MSRTPLPPVTVAMIALVGVLCAGCGADASSGAGSSGPAGSAAASSAGGGASGGAGGSAVAGSSGGEPRATDGAKGVKFAECMRRNGVGDFPDPDPSGDFTYGVSVTPEVWKKALEACKDLQPPGTLSGKRSPEQQSAALKFAQCVRENGVKDFPDPVNGEPLVDTYRIPSAARSGGMTILNAAMQKCRALVQAAAGSRP